LFKEGIEASDRNTGINVVVHLNGNAFPIAFSNAKASGKHDLVLQRVFFDCLFHQLHDLVRAFDMTRTTDTNLNDHFLSPLRIVPA
jgi:hypothetical protein